MKAQFLPPRASRLFVVHGERRDGGKGEEEEWWGVEEREREGGREKNETLNTIVRL